MFQYVSLLILAFAVSIDSFGVGITYGMRKITIPLRSIIIIAICSGAMILLATVVAQGMIYLISPDVAEILGGLILIGLGSWALYHFFTTRYSYRESRRMEKKYIQDHGLDHQEPVEKRVWRLEIKKLGIVIQILRTPMVADIDRSGEISGKEAFILGLALSLDAFGAGIGAALMGYSPWLTALLIATMSSLFVYIGIRFGGWFARAKWMKRIGFLPGVILILFGLSRIIM